MDEQAIRMWAWVQLAGYEIADEGDAATRKPVSMGQRLQFGDDLAAWVMSGKLPK